MTQGLRMKLGHRGMVFLGIIPFRIPSLREQPSAEPLTKIARVETLSLWRHANVSWFVRILSQAHSCRLWSAAAPAPKSHQKV